MSERSGVAAVLAPDGGPTAPYLARWSPSGDCRRWLLDASLVTVGRAATADVVLDDDPLVSRLHLTLERVADVWTLVDQGLSRNGTFVNGRRVLGRFPLRDRDAILVGRTQLTFCFPGQVSAEHTLVGEPLLAAAKVTTAQRAVLVALCRPYHQGLPGPTPATNQAIADELVLSVDAVKSHLRALFHLFGIDDLPQNQKRARLAEIAQQSGLVSSAGR